MFGPDLPEPADDRLVMYVLGAGFGESVVLALPNGATVVVDACTSGGVVLPRALMSRLRKDALTLLVLTHPDLDHIGGAGVLVDELRPADVWTYPMSSSIRDAVATYARTSKAPRYVELARALKALDAHQTRTGRVAETNYGRTISFGETSIHALAPTHYDQGRASSAWRRFLRAKRGVRERLDAVLTGQLRLGDAPNVLSMALAVEYGPHRVVLGGDVMRGAKSAHSGWKGVLELLRADDDRDGTDRVGLLRDLSAVKVAHHGSLHSFEPAVWALHCGAERPIAALAPFEHGGTSLPDAATLRELAERSRALLVTAGSQTLANRAAAAGFAPAPDVRALRKTTAAVVAIELLHDGGRVMHASRSALGLYAPSPAGARA